MLSASFHRMSTFFIFICSFIAVFDKFAQSHRSQTVTNVPRSREAYIAIRNISKNTDIKAPAIEKNGIISNLDS